ncbi:MAG: hypothetical protein KF755_03400 [Burkholderiaceae bacterium]|nr:hypothetical protein [Burkholderiaceae bacterium]
MNKQIDLGYRPETYFRPQKLERYLLSKVKGAVVRKKLQALFDSGRHAELSTLLTVEGISAADRKVLESLHPMFMGGNYLPDTEDGEVEIGRISIKSTTYDVTCVYARPDGGAIHYRVVDEYGGETLQGATEARTAKPMTLGEFADFFITAWPLIAVLEMNFEDDVEGALGFFSADSDFYPDLDRLCRQRVRDHFPTPDAGDECPFCGRFNSPPADDLCEHAAAWVWDGQIEALGTGQAFAAAIQELGETIGSAEHSTTAELILEKLAGQNPVRARLIDAASDGLEEALSLVENAQAGDGWSTKGMLGGSGYTVCVPDSAALDVLASECRALVRACALEIQTADTRQVTLEALRPSQRPDWQLVASGFWEEDTYHSGHIAYYIASIGPGKWLLDGVERNAMLDGVTQEDVDEGRLNDDQIQAMWGMRLEEAQSSEHRQICAACSGASEELLAKEMAEILYRAVCEGGGKEITEPDDSAGLLEL